MPSRRALFAATSTVGALAVLTAVAIGTNPPSQAGKATASAPIVRTKVETTKRTVHVRNKRTIKVVRSSPAAAAGTVAVAAAVEQAGSAPSPASQAVTRSGEPSESYSESGNGREYESREDSAEREHEDTAEIEDHREEGDD